MKISEIYKKTKQIYSFSDTSVKRLLFVSVILGIGSAYVEYLFVLVFQAFLSSFGILKATFISNKFISGMSGFNLTVLLIAVALTRSLTEGAKIFVSRYIQQRFCTENRKRLIELSLNNLSELSTAKIIAIFSEEIQRLSFSVLNISSFLINLFSAIFLFLICLKLAMHETAIAITIMVVLSLPLSLLNRFFYNVGSDLKKNWEKTSELLTGAIRNNFFLKVYGLIPKTIKNANYHLDQYLALYTRTFKVLGIKSSAASFFGIIAVIGICVSREALHSSTSPESVLSFFYVFLRFTQALVMSAGLLSEFKINTENLDEIKYVLQDLKNKTFENFDESELITNKFDSSNLEITCDGVTFGYEKSKSIFQKISFKITEGNILLISGPSGSGKSTLLSLIIGLVEPEAGSILINNKKVSELKTSLKNIIGYVGPYPYLIDGTVKENLFYSHPSSEKITNEQIKTALIDSQSEFVYNLKDGMNTKVDEHGLQLSTGQKQRLMLARALLRNPKILILDEFTANLDEKNETEILDMIVKDRSNKITIIVSHRQTFQKIADHHISLSNEGHY